MRRVVLTGLGIISPLGIGKEAFWRSLVAGRSATKHLSEATTCGLYDQFAFDSQVIAEVEGFDAERLGLPAEVRRLDRFIQFAVAGANQAIEDACLPVREIDRERFGIALSTAICGTRQLEAEFIEVTDRGRAAIDPSRVSPHLYLAAMSNTPSLILSAMTGAQGPCLTLSTGCIGGADAIGYAFEAIRYGEADVMLAGASEAPITPITTASFEIIRCLSRRHNNAPEKASRPFDAGRDGFVLAEGCGVLVLEELEHARARGARMYAEVSGFSVSSNAQHMTDLLSDGADLARAIGDSLDQSGTAPCQVDHVNAHGSSTVQNDGCETSAIVQALGAHARRIPINSTKSMSGHPLAAASALEIAGCALAFQHGFVHPTINYEQRDPACDLDYVPNEGRPWQGQVILSDASGFSGLHASIVLRALEQAA